MRFLADENVSRLVIERLRAGGFNVISIHETRSGAPDKDVLEAAGAEGCILITEDRDFGELVIRQRLSVRGMILLELDRLSNAAEADAVTEVVSTHADKLVGQSGRDRARADSRPATAAVRSTLPGRRRRSRVHQADPARRHAAGVGRAGGEDAGAGVMEMRVCQHWHAIATMHQDIQLSLRCFD